MMHRPSHWILLFLVALAMLFTLREVHGQGVIAPSTGAGTQFEGMPAMGGAQAGLGAQAGPPQGGLGVQGSDASGLRLNRPRGLDEPRSVMRAEIQRDPTEIRPSLAANDQPAEMLPPVTPAPRIPQRETTRPGRDTGVARDTGSSTKVAARSVKRAAKRMRHHSVAQLDMR